MNSPVTKRRYAPCRDHIAVLLSAARLDGPAVIADTGYYNRTDIKNCIDDDMTVYIKKAKANNRTKDNKFRKEKFTCKALLRLYLSSPSINRTKTRYPFGSTPVKFSFL